MTQSEEDPRTGRKGGSEGKHKAPGTGRYAHAMPSGCGKAVEGRPALKLVVAASGEAWIGDVYPTQLRNGVRRHFSSRDEFLAAVAELAGWEDQP